MTGIDPRDNLDEHTQQHLRTLLRAPGLAEVFAALGPRDARIVGGAVRNALLGQPVTDIDIATTLPPREAMARLRRAGFSVHPVGIEHGSIIAAKDGQAFEVTTLRRDVKTDGRHAQVAFTTDWAQDAQRRDFTMNALYLDADGQLHDHVGGLADLKARRLRFIGDAARRIREDYLRILRFFRFWATYAAAPPDDETLATIATQRQGLKRISKERIRQETRRLLSAPKAVEALRLMERTGVADMIFPADCARDLTALERMAAQDAALDLAPEWFLRLIAFCGPHESLRQAFRLTREETKRLRWLAKAARPADEQEWKRLIYHHGPQAARDLARLAAARGDLPEEGLRGLLTLLQRWRPPTFLPGGKDAVALGLPPGPAVGEALRRAEERFVANGFAPADRAGQIALLREVVADMRAGNGRA